MVKLTPEIIEQAVQYVNAVRDRELILRGYKIPVIENLGATLDQFDTIDFSDNDLRKFEGFPLLKRIRSLMFNNNRICRIEEDIHLSIPNLKELYFTNNEIAELTDLDYLEGFKHLEFLSLLRNPVTHHKEYRLYVIHKLPQVRVLDFRKVKQREREEAKKLFGSKKGETLLNDIKQKSKNRTFTPGKPTQPTASISGPSAQDKQAIKEAIMKAKSLEEIENLKRMLQSGKIPGKDKNGLTNGADKEEETEMEVS
ncbi:U2 small nuclear ribonucleoprotein A'-like [Styela clava]|uniref:U2 small nuclear ribonucleoprotein A'-like n=1 Tax=Styela clava TaxID=7725 RepID=UPI0019398872|nr:U2 small nuclear ribonucleoprotein A'-like [Styela clava]